MANEIIINGIDVSECNFRLERDNRQKCECCHATGFGVICDCEKWHNCHFKERKRAEQKLQAKEQKCKKLKKFEQLFFKIRELYLQNKKFKNQLINENEDLKDTIKKFTCQAECYKHKEAEKYKQECNHWKNQCLCLDGEDVTVQITQEQFEEYQKLKEENEEQNAIIKELLHDCNSCKFHQYKQALDEIEEFCIVYSNNHDAYETVYKHILDIINKAKKGN